MKKQFALALLITFSLATGPCLFAQELETPTDRPSPTPRPTPEKTEAEPVTSAEEAASPAEKPSPAAKSSPAKAYPTPGETSASPAAPALSPAKTGAAKPSPAKAGASPAAAAPSLAQKPWPKGNVNAQLKEIENRWATAILTKDVPFMEMILADDYVGTSFEGKRFTKANEITQMQKGGDTYKSVKNARLKVQTFAANVAVVTGDLREVGAAKDGKAFDRTYRYTDTWVQRNGRWQCVASQWMQMK